MKRVILLLIICFMFTFYGCASTNATPSASSQKHDFRLSTWGMSMEQVSETEGRKADSSGDDYLMYDNIVVLNMPCSVFYGFEDGKLNSGQYMFDMRQFNEKDYITCYKVIVDNIAEYMGPPSVSNADWKNDTYKNEPDKYGLAIASGDLGYMSFWETDQVTVTCSLEGDKDINIINLNAMFFKTGSK